MGQCTLHVSIPLPTPPHRPNLLECVPVDYCLRIYSQRIRCRVDIDQQTFFSASMISSKIWYSYRPGSQQPGYRIRLTAMLRRIVRPARRASGWWYETKTGNPDKLFIQVQRQAARVPVSFPKEQWPGWLMLFEHRQSLATDTDMAFVHDLKFLLSFEAPMIQT